MLALFDLDNTLIGGDSDHAWGEFLCQHGHVDAASYRARNEAFFRDYQNGSLDMEAFLEFALRPLRDTAPETLRAWRKAFLEEYIQPMMLPAAQELLEKHRRQNDELVIITATNRFITEPIAELLGVQHLIATELEMKGEHYTGRLAGTPCFQEGKVSRLQEWAQSRDLDPFQSTFYSDSANDLPLLEKVRIPCAVDPDNKLRSIATERQWTILSLREQA